MSLKLVLISDTHMQMDKIDLPEGDILCHAGDHTYRGTVPEMSKALKQLAEKGKNFKKIITIMGNHDWLGQNDPHLMQQLCNDNGLVYLRDNWTVAEGMVFYGSPWQPEFCGWAFNLPRGPAIAKKWDLIYDKTDVLITHGPPKNILDKCPDGFNAGCEELWKKVIEIKPKIHVFGHIHAGYGVQHFDGITFVNASCCDEQYKPINKPVEIELE